MNILLGLLVGIIALIFAFVCGYRLALGRPRKLPCEGATLEIESVALDGQTFHAYYKGKLLSFKASDYQSDLSPGTYKVFLDAMDDSDEYDDDFGEGDLEVRILRRVVD